MSSKYHLTVETLVREPGITANGVLSELMKTIPGPVALFERTDEATGMLTVLGFDPFEVIRSRQGQTTVEDRRGLRKVSGDPFQVAGQRMRDYQGSSHDGSPPFAGAAIGYFGYDCIRFLEPTVAATPGNLKNTTLERSPHLLQCDAELFFFKQLIIFQGEQIFLVSGYRSDFQSAAEGKRQAQKEIEALHQFIARSKTRSKKSESYPKADLDLKVMDAKLGRSGFIRGVRKLKEHIRAGDIFQAVLSDQFSVPFHGDPLGLFKILSDQSPAPYRFYLRSEGATYLGASPEMLIRLTGDELETHPIAGTRPRGATKVAEQKLERQLLRSEKEKSEHLMLVDLARNDLGRVSRPGSVQVASYMKLKKFAGVMHLVSKVTGKILPRVDAFGALASCFPAGTLSGAPKIRAMQLISEIEPCARGFYGGAMVIAGYAGDLDSSIAIRSISLRDGRATIQAGAGIVADSRPESEYDEVKHKSQTARKALGIALKMSGRKKAAR